MVFSVLFDILVRFGFFRFGFGSVFQFQAYKIKPVGFLKILISLISFFHDSIFLVIFFWFFQFNQFFNFFSYSTYPSFFIYFVICFVLSLSLVLTLLNLILWFLWRLHVNYRKSFPLVELFLVLFSCTFMKITRCLQPTSHIQVIFVVFRACWKWSRDCSTFSRICWWHAMMIY